MITCFYHTQAHNNTHEKLSMQSYSQMQHGGVRRKSHRGELLEELTSYRRLVCPQPIVLCAVVSACMLPDLMLVRRFRRELPVPALRPHTGRLGEAQRRVRSDIKGGEKDARRRRRRREEIFVRCPPKQIVEAPLHPRYK